MLTKLIRKTHFIKTLYQLRGAKKLRSNNNPFFVANTVGALTEIHLGIKESDFPKILVGSHASESELILRQILLQSHTVMCSSVMQSIGNDRTFAMPIPSAWVCHLKANGIKCSILFSQILLLIKSLKRLISGLIKFFILISQVNNSKYYGSYVAFLGLKQDNIPSYSNQKSVNIISWYKGSKLRHSYIKKIWIQASVGKKFVTQDDIEINSQFFPKFSSLFEFVKFLLFALATFSLCFLKVLIGKWWYGFFYFESIQLHYAKSIGREKLAREYFFNNSSWFYKPLWTHEVESRGSFVTLYYYSTNIVPIDYTNSKYNDAFGLKIMSWNRIIVWNKYQEEYLKKFAPNAHYIRVGYLDYVGKVFYKHYIKKKNILSIFDVSPTRPIAFTKLGYAIAPYYSEDLNLKFLEDIKEIFNDEKWIILWKPKRNTKNITTSEAFKSKQLKLIGDNLVQLDTNFAASSLVEASDAVISIPFSSPSIIAKFKEIPCIFYDASGCVKIKSSNGIHLLKSKDELKMWFQSLGP
jgi:polysaccharide biosynthesis PFTS motif protein